MGKGKSRHGVVKKKIFVSASNGTGISNAIACTNNNDICPCPSCSGRGWRAGRGGGGNKKKSDKRDKSCMEKARSAAFLEEAMNANGSLDLERFVKIFPGLEHDEQQRLFGYLNRILSLRGGRWEELIKQICNRHDPRKEWSKIEAKSSSILEDLDHAREEFGFDKKRCFDLGIVFPSERTYHYNRAQGRIGLGNLEGAIEDLTEALMVQPFPTDPNDDPRSRVYDVDILFERAKCHWKLENLEEAIVDLKASHSGLRILGDAWDGRVRTATGVVQYLLMAMVKQKQQNGQTRPYYSRMERDSIEKDLGLNSYCEPSYHCLECGATPPSVKLKHCARCRQVWFCSKACQTKAWKKGHRSVCRQELEIMPAMLDIDKAIVEQEFERLGGVTYIHGGGDATYGQPFALLRDPSTGRLFDALTNSDAFFLPSESSDLMNAIMAHPADKVDGMQLVTYTSLKNLKESLSGIEVEWTKDSAFMFKELEPGNRDFRRAEKMATGALISIHKGLSTFSTPFALWVAKINLITAFMHRSWCRLETNKFKEAIDDATDGLSHVKSMQDWIRNLDGPIHYFVREEVRLLFIRSQCLKRLGDFDAALVDLRTCRAIISSMGDFWTDHHAHLNSVMFPLESDPSETISLEVVTTRLQIILALQKVRDEAPRPHYSVDERVSLETEFGLSSFDDERTLYGPRIINNENMGALDEWAFEQYGVFVVTIANESRVLCSDGDGGHFESITNEPYYLLSPELAQKTASLMAEFGRTMGYNVREM